MTAFKRRGRLHQAAWREANGYPIGTYRPPRGKTDIAIGSRVSYRYARASGANFVTKAAHDAAIERVANPEPHQTLNEERLFSDLLSSMPMCFNLFGDLRHDNPAATKAKQAWWPDVPGQVEEVRFEWSPGRLDPYLLHNRTAFDAAMLLRLDDGTRGVLGIETKYHEHPQRGPRPSTYRLPRYMEVATRSGLFRPATIKKILGTELQQLWLDHLLVLAMLQHPSNEWTWGRFVVVFPAGNVGFRRLTQEYRELLTDPSSFAASTLEDLVDNPSALSATTRAALRSRYIF